LSEFAIRTEGLRKVYKTGFLRREYVALHGLDLNVRRGEVFGLIGPNGAGKTTTLKLLMGLNAPSGGRGWILDEPIGSLSALAKVGFLPERPYFYDYLTATEFLHFYGQLHGIGKDQRRRKIEELLPLVHMERARGTQLRKFSKGMLQRVGIAQALMNEPELVVLDEPSSGLDPMGRMLIRDIVRGLKRKGTTVLFCSHVLSDVEEVSDRVGILIDGTLQEVGSVDELVEQRTEGIEITCEGLDEAALATLPSEPLRRTARDHHVFRAEDHEAARALLAQINAAGGALVSYEPLRESLEQHFVDEATAVERQAREEAAR